MTSQMNRRQVFALGAGAMAAMAIDWTTLPAWAETNGFERLISEFTNGKAAQEGRIRLDLPEIADDGNAVPMTITVESPMTAESYVTEILVVADGNPRPGVATFHLSPANGVAEVSTRIRLAQTETVTAVAKMNDGSFWRAKKEVKVTVGGCGVS